MPEFLVHMALEPVNAESQVNMTLSAQIDEGLIQQVIQRLIQAFQIQKNHCAPNVHTYLDTVDAETVKGEWGLDPLLKCICRSLPAADLCVLQILSEIAAKNDCGAFELRNFI